MLQVPKVVIFRDFFFVLRIVFPLTFVYALPVLFVILLSDFFCFCFLPHVLFCESEQFVPGFFYIVSFPVKFARFAILRIPFIDAV